MPTDVRCLIADPVGHAIMPAVARKHQPPLDPQHVTLPAYDTWANLARQGPGCCDWFGVFPILSLLSRIRTPLGDLGHSPPTSASQQPPNSDTDALGEWTISRRGICSSFHHER